MAAFKSLSVAVLRLRDFRFLLLTRMMVVMALQAQAVIVGWQIYSITKDPFMLGLIGLAEAVPAISCALFAGHIVDISRPHRVFLTCLGTLVLNTLMLFLLGGHIIPMAMDSLVVWLFGGIFFSGMARSFIMPSSFSLLPQIVPRVEIPAASAWLNSGFQLAAISGPAIAGLVYGGYGPTGAWALPMGLMLIGFVSLACVSNEPRNWKSAQMREPAVQSMKAGWRFILQNPTLLSVMALDMFAVLFGGAVAMLPAFADQVLHTGSEGLGALRAAPALGAIFTALFFALKPMQVMRGNILLWVVAGFGMCMIGFGLSTHFWMAMFFLAASGAFDSVSMIIRGTLMQLLTPDSMRGRVSSVESMFIISSNEIGAFESGLAARLLGLVPSILFGGVATLTIVALIATLSPRMRQTAVRADQALP